MTDGPSDPWSATALDLRERMRALRRGGSTAAVATVVAVEGSAYRRPGAKMVLTPDGDQLGGITAGCLEGPVGELAAEVFETGGPVLETFDLVDDEEWGLGLGCNGVIDVLVEPLDSSWDPVLAAVGDGRSVATVTAVDGDGPVPAGARAVVDAEAAVLWPVDGGDGAADDVTDGAATTSAATTGVSTDGDRRATLPTEAVAVARDLAVETAEAGGTTTATVDVDGEAVRLLVDAVEPPDRLVVFGGQPDSNPLARLARQVGLHVTVATPRGGRAEPERYPAAHEVVAVRPTDVGELLDGRTAVAIMTHNLLDDELALAAALETEAPYVGVMGPRDRFERIREELADDGVTLDGDQLDRVAAPVGLDLGGGAPVEIALSIVAEVVAVTNGRDGGRLRDREAPIHAAAGPAAED